MRNIVALYSVYQDLRDYALLAIIALCFLIVGAIILLFTHLLEKSNDYGDDDMLGLRKGDSESKTIGSSLGEDLAVGALHSMKNFRADEVSRK